MCVHRVLEVPAAYVPVALNQPDKDKIKLLQHLCISTAVVHYKVLQVQVKTIIIYINVPRNVHTI